jgi:hypothetical protein
MFRIGHLEAIFQLKILFARRSVVCASICGQGAPEKIGADKKCSIQGPRTASSDSIQARLSQNIGSWPAEAVFRVSFLFGFAEE